MCGVGVGYLVNHFQPDDEPSWFVTVAKSCKTGPSTQWIFEQSNQMINLFQNFSWAGILNLGKANVKKIWKNLRNLTDGWYFTKHIYNLFSAQSNIFYFLPKHLNAVHKSLWESIFCLEGGRGGVFFYWREAKTARAKIFIILIWLYFSPALFEPWLSRCTLWRNLSWWCPPTQGRRWAGWTWRSSWWSPAKTRIKTKIMMGRMSRWTWTLWTPWNGFVSTCFEFGENDIESTLSNMYLRGIVLALST